jgi:hypothetical protein
LSEALDLPTGVRPRRPRRTRSAARHWMGGAVDAFLLRCRIGAWLGRSSGHLVAMGVRRSAHRGGRESAVRSVGGRNRGAQSRSFVWPLSRGGGPGASRRVGGRVIVSVARHVRAHGLLHGPVQGVVCGGEPVCDDEIFHGSMLAVTSSSGFVAARPARGSVLLVGWRAVNCSAPCQSGVFHSPERSTRSRRAKIRP